MQLKKNYIWAIGIVVFILLLLASGYLGQVIESAIVVAVLALVYTLINYSATKYGV